MRWKRGCGSALCVLALASLGGCGEGGKQPADGTPAARAVADETSDSTADFVFPSCPEDAEFRRLSIEATATVIRWCERTGPLGGQVRHGPWEKRLAGRVVENGSYRDGLRHGRWNLNWSSGEPQSEGEYRDGERVGVWIFRREDGSEIRRIDYGESDAATLEVSEQETPTELEAPPLVTLRVENSRSSDLVFSVEPEAESWTMPPGTAFEVRARGAAPGEILVEATEAGISVWPGTGAETVLVVEGVEIQP